MFFNGRILLSSIGEKGFMMEDYVSRIIGRLVVLRHIRMCMICGIWTPLNFVPILGKFDYDVFFCIDACLIVGIQIIVSSSW